MPIKTAIWRVGTPPSPLPESSLPSEAVLEKMIVAAPAILSHELLLIGQQVNTSSGGRVDFLAIAPDGALTLVELKRAKTPREIVAQALDYAWWVERLSAQDIAQIYEQYRHGASLVADFKTRFGSDLDEENLNGSHQIVIVAEGLDAATERIVEYLNKRNVSINVLFFQVFADSTGLFLSRSWLLDPVKTQANVSTGAKGQSEPWNGEFYSSFGHGPNRSWDDAVRYGFICGGGGPWYSKTLQLLTPGDRVWVNVPSIGYVGVARVTSEAQPFAEFWVRTDAGEIPFQEADVNGTYHREYAHDPERCEYFVPVDWLQTVPLQDAIKEVGLFGNQNTVCKPTTPKWRHTVVNLKARLPNYDRTPSVSPEAPEI